MTTRSDGDENVVVSRGNDGRREPGWLCGGDGGGRGAGRGVHFAEGYVRRLKGLRNVKREPKERRETWSSAYSSKAGVRGRGRGLLRRRSGPGEEAVEKLLLAEWRGVGSGGQSLKRLSRYAGRVLQDGRVCSIVMMAVEGSCGESGTVQRVSRVSLGVCCSRCVRDWRFVVRLTSSIVRMNRSVRICRTDTDGLVEAVDKCRS